MVIDEVKIPRIKKYTTIYDKFKGVDFSQDPSLVDKSRSPEALNLISGDGNIPEKRTGWRILKDLNGAINGIFDYNYEKIVHAGTKIYKYVESTDTATELYSNCADSKSVSCYMGGKLYIFTGTEYLVYDGETIASVVGRIPTVIIGRSPTGGGTPYEGINLISDKKIDSFLGNATDTSYQLSAIDIASVDKVEVLNSSLVWETYTEVESSPNATQYTVNKTTGKVYFNAPKEPIEENEDNVRITYSKTISGYADRIKKCTIVSLYGVGGDNRIFASGNSDFKNYDWYSGMFDPTYFSDLNYSIVGSEETAITGYSKFGNYQIIVKKSSQTQGTIYKRIGTLTSSGDVLFTIQTGTSGLGAIASNSFANLIDEPLFLTKQGIFALSTINILSDNVIRNRSLFVDTRLIIENNIEQAEACEYDGYYMLFINTRVYILDSRQKTSVGRSDIDFVYECYYWDNIPARRVLSSPTGLYFGTSDGKLCKFNYDQGGMYKYNDNNVAIDAFWTTKNDDDGVPYLFKKTYKKGNFVTIKPNTRSSASVGIILDSGIEKNLVESSVKMNRFSFDDIDFENLTFETSDSPKEIYYKPNAKNYKRSQYIVRNNVINEAFGVFQIGKTYTVGRYANV